jgi:hypothetical protein
MEMLVWVMKLWVLAVVFYEDEKVGMGYDISSNMICVIQSSVSVALMQDMTVDFGGEGQR